MSNNLSINLKKTSDRYGKTYYVGKIEAPMLIDCSDGAAFLVFVSEDGEEQLQIAPMTKKNKSRDVDYSDETF